MVSRWKWSRWSRVLYVSPWVGLFGKTGASDAPSERSTVIIFSTANFIGLCVGCRNVFNQLSYRGGLDLIADISSPDWACVCACLCCRAWPAVESLADTLLFAGLSDSLEKVITDLLVKSLKQLLSNDIFPCRSSRKGPFLKSLSHSVRCPFFLNILLAIFFL